MTTWPSARRRSARRSSTVGAMERSRRTRRQVEPRGADRECQAETYDTVPLASGPRLVTRTAAGPQRSLWRQSRGISGTWNRSRNSPNITHAGPSILVEDVCKVLLEFVLGDEFRYYDSCIPQLAVRADGVDPPRLPVPSHGKDPAEDIEA